MRVIVLILGWVALSAACWWAFAVAIVPLFGREGGSGHLVSFVLALAIWLALSAFAPKLLPNRRRR